MDALLVVVSEKPALAGASAGVLVAVEGVKPTLLKLNPAAVAVVAGVPSVNPVELIPPRNSHPSHAI